MARKLSKGKKPKETMRQRQMRLRREELAKKKLVKSSRYTPASQRVDKVKVKVEPQKKLTGTKTTKYLPASKKGGPLVSTKGPRRRNITGNPSKGTQMGTKGSGIPQIKLPKASIRSAGAASKALSTTGKVAGRIALPLSAYQTAKDLADSLKRGEGYAKVPGLIKKLAESSGTKTSGGSTNRRGRRSGPAPQPAAKPATPKKRLANIPPAEGKPGSPSYVKPKTDKTSSTKASPPTDKKPAAPKPTAKAESSADNMRTWALANEEMINKVGTKTQKAILKKALKPKKPKKKKSSALAIGGYA